MKGLDTRETTKNKVYLEQRWYLMNIVDVVQLGLTS